MIFLDADMTFIQCEMINVMSRLAGKVTDVDEITNCAMDGQLISKKPCDNELPCLKVCDLIDRDRLILNTPYTPGVECLVYILKTLGYQIGIMSGGLNRIIDHIKQRFYLDYGFANTLEVKN